MSTARPSGGGRALNAPSSRACRARRSAPGCTSYRSAKSTTVRTTGPAFSVSRSVTSAPGPTAKLTAAGPPNQVSVHPPMSQIRTGADARIAMVPSAATDGSRSYRPEPIGLQAACPRSSGTARYHCSLLVIRWPGLPSLPGPSGRTTERREREAGDSWSAGRSGRYR